MPVDAAGQLRDSDYQKLIDDLWHLYQSDDLNLLRVVAVAVPATITDDGLLAARRVFLQAAIAAKGLGRASLHLAIVPALERPRACGYRGGQLSLPSSAAGLPACSRSIALLSIVSANSLPTSPA